MIVVTGLVALGLLWFGTVCVRGELRSWRSPVAYAPWRARLEPETTRALLVVGVFQYFLGALVGLVDALNATGVMGGSSRLPVALVAPLVLLLLGVTASGWTILAIAWFNRPRFLVPPRLRDQPGLVSVRRRRPAAPRIRTSKRTRTSKRP
ncbi:MULTISPECIES: hypothetical protein [Kitasatospora]|uniref:Uncharacterized protein n=1 Tax=Kitasatospora setae (strain ATCC 33774 / DSM 43861 / JCM 3304 / KCC A-0304 / NBRC 14216 / KM-6054) TaxID=452652 RepID=E4N5Y1_KITSK|nr:MULTISPECIES: hypothetical protein [Kitasatospora]BAJ26612.1 hypothetical protein KSE_07730 [Kitasatospora setae KM-6054]